MELNLEKSYFLGSHNYKEFIETVFFNELVEKKVCQYQKMLFDECFGTYVCDSKSELFLDYLYTPSNLFPFLSYISWLI